MMLNIQEKRLVGAVAALVVTGLVAACGGDGGAQVAAERESPNAQRVSTAPDSGGQVPVPESVQPSETADVADPVVRNVTYSDAAAVFHAGRYEDATGLFGAYVESHPRNPWGHYMLGLSAWRSGNRDQAEEALRRAIELDEEHVKSYTNLGRVLIEQGRARDAVPHLAQAVELEPESPDVWRVLGNAKGELGEREEALDAYRQALTLNDQDVWSMNNYGFLLIQGGRYEAAVPPLARAVELKPDSPVFQNNLGIALERSGELEGARRAFAAAIGADGTYEKAKTSFDRVDARMGSMEREAPDLTELARSFVEEMRSWRTSAAAEPIEPPTW